MSDHLVARAPGKLFVLGEYAVLDGCPAVVAAIDRHVEVRLQRVTRGTTVRIAAPGFGALNFSAAEPPPAEGELRFAIAAYRSALARSAELGRMGFTVTIESKIQGAAPSGKFGLGSSAAVTVALVAALSAMVGNRLSEDAERNDLFATAFEAHRLAQGGTGSGADVAASVYGGLVHFQPRAGSIPLVTRLAYPPETILLAAWTGEAAPTQDLAGRYLAAGNGSAAGRAAFVDATRRCVDRFVTSVAGGSLALSAVDENGALLERFASQAGLPVMTPRLQRLVSIAREHGAAAKVSGAGGGDCGVALTPDRAAAARIRRAWGVAGLTPLDIAISSEGVTLGHC